MNYFIQPLSTFLTADMPNVDIKDASEGVVNISEAISKYGLAVVIMAVFFVIFMILIVIMLYSNTKMINQIISSKSESDKQDQSIISKFVDSALDAKGVSGKDEIVDTLSHELKESLLPITKQLESMATNTMEHNNEHGDDYHRDIVGAYIDINMVFKDISRATLSALNCDRVAIYVFHNGNKSMLGLPFFKMSCIHEWTLHGSSTLRGKSHMDMPLHLFNDFVENLYKNGFYKSENLDYAIKEDPSLKEFMAFSNTKSFYMIGIYGADNTLTGFVSAEFNSIETFDSDEKRNLEVKRIMDNMILKISPIVANKYVFRHNEDHN